MVLITPLWQAQPWYSQVLEMCIKNPLLLPIFPKLLQDPQGNLHELILEKFLQLVTCRIPGKIWKCKEYQKSLQSLSSNYESAWEEWCLWCGEQKVDNVRCCINYVLDFLVWLFRMEFEYATIDSHRSTISVYHD